MEILTCRTMETRTVITFTDHSMNISCNNKLVARFDLCCVSDAVNDELRKQCGLGNCGIERRAKQVEAGIEALPSILTNLR